MNLGRAIDKLFDAVAAYWHAPMPAERLATLRILSGLFATIYVAARIFYFASYAKMTPSQFKPIGVVSFADGPLPEATTWAIAIVCVLSGAAFSLGFHYRIAAPIFGATLLWVFTYRSSWGMIFHTENLLCLHILALSLAPSAADAYAFDARRKKRSEEPHGRYGWPVRLMCGITVLAYLAAGITKLENSGIAWVNSDLLQNYVAYDQIRKVELGSVHSAFGGYLSEHHPGIFKPLAAYGVGFELAAPLAMIGPRIAKWWVASAVFFHVGVLAVMAIFFPYPILLIGFASFFEVEKLAERVIARVRR